MAEMRAFALRSEYGEPKDFNGSVTVPGGTTYDVGRALSSSKNGVIVLDAERDGRKIEALAVYPPMKEVSGSQKSQASNGGQAKRGRPRKTASESPKGKGE